MSCSKSSIADHDDHDWYFIIVLSKLPLKAKNAIISIKKKFTSLAHARHYININLISKLMHITPLSIPLIGNAIILLSSYCFLFDNSSYLWKELQSYCVLRLYFWKTNSVKKNSSLLYLPLIHLKMYVKCCQFVNIIMYACYILYKLFLFQFQRQLQPRGRCHVWGSRVLYTMTVRMPTPSAPMDCANVRQSPTITSTEFVVSIYEFNKWHIFVIKLRGMVKGLLILQLYHHKVKVVYLPK